MKGWFRYLLCVFACLPLCASASGYCARIPYTEAIGKMIVEVRVNGKPGRFLFDTGAPVCLTHAFAAGMELETLGVVKTQDSNGAVSENRVVLLNSLAAGGVNFTQVQAAMLEEGNMIERFGVDGILGYSLFGDKVVEIDSRKKQIAIAGSEDYFELNPAQAMPMITDTRVPLVVVKLSGEALDTVMFDSGAGGFFDLSERTYRRLQSEKAWILLSRGRGVLSLGAGGLEENALKYRVKIPLLTIGSGQFANVVTQTTAGNDSRLGSGLLNYGSVVLDYRKGLFYYRPYEEAVKEMFRKDWNVVITAMNDELKAGFVWESMWGELKGGEKVVEVNGKRFDKVDVWQAMTTDLVGLSGEEAEIVVVDETGKEKKLVIRKE